MKLGFTGTREGMTAAQEVAFCRWVDKNPPTEFHHGCCVGADATAARYVGEAFCEVAIVHAHLSDLPGKFTDGDAKDISDVVHKAKPPLDRNRDIVDASAILLACPKGPEEQRSGTWATIRYAKKRQVLVMIFWPDGTVEAV